MSDCFSVLEQDHLEHADAFRFLKEWPCDRVIDALRARFNVIEYRPAVLQNGDVVLWQDTNQHLHLSIYRGNVFHLVGRDGKKHNLPVTVVSTRKIPLRPSFIVRK